MADSTILSSSSSLTAVDWTLIIAAIATGVASVVNALGNHWGRKARQEEVESTKRAVSVEAGLVKDALEHRAKGIDNQLETIHQATNGGTLALREDLKAARAEVKSLRNLLNKRTSMLLRERSRK